MDQLILGTTMGSSHGLAVNEAMRHIQAGQDFTYIDPKASIYPVSKRQTKRLLMRAGLSPADAGRYVREAIKSGYLMQAIELRKAMKHGRRNAKSWFPWDTVITSR